MEENNMEKKVVVNKKGQKVELSVFKYGEKIPEELKYGRYINGELFFGKAIKKTDEEKATLKAKKTQELKKKWTEVSKENEKLNKEIKETLKKVSETKTEIKKNALTKDVSGLREKLGVLLAQVEELKSKKKLIPSKFKK